MRNFIDIAVMLNESLDPSPADIIILRDMFTRADQTSFREWALENGADEATLAEEEGLLYEFSYWLEQEHSTTVSDGLIEFWRLDSQALINMIGDNPVRLHHFTSSLRVRSIRKEGLVTGKRSVNRTVTPGVYLTTETSGPAITGYLRNATRGSRTAYGVRVDVRVTLREIEPDPDDADIQSGATQFVTDYIPPEQIISIDRA